MISLIFRETKQLKDLGGTQSFVHALKFHISFANKIFLGVILAHFPSEHLLSCQRHRGQHQTESVWMLLSSFHNHNRQESGLERSKQQSKNLPQCESLPG